MSPEIVIQPQLRMWLETSILQPYVSHYSMYLHRERYAVNTQRVYLRCIAHFAHWLSTEGCGLDQVGEATAARFLLEHVPACDCPAPVRRVKHELRAAIAILCVVLREEGIGTKDPTPDTAAAQELAYFDRHMRDVWGLAESTRRRRVLVIREFLQFHFGSQPIVTSNISTTSVRRFILKDRGLAPSTISIIGSAVSCYLRYRSMSGDPVSELIAAIPRAAQWRLASLPDVLSDAEIDELLQSFHDPFPSRQRAYAIIRCLIDLGLRSSEVINLHLDDIDWAQGTVRLNGTKGRRADVLPLPSATGMAISAYLHEERPQTSNRAIFVRHVAPYDKPLEKTSVKRAVEDGYKRCGWSCKGVHILRHSLASRLLRHGVPMKDIADVLRHRSLNTSAIYAKVDFDKLSAVALPWPGSKT